MNNITDITKNEIFQILLEGLDYENEFINYDEYERSYPDYEEVHADMPYYGKSKEIDFWNRVFNLEELPSTDNRFDNVQSDIWQHTINNEDWDYDWYIDYHPFQLRNGDDEFFLRFISEIFHPAVRNEKQPWQEYLKKFNDLLKYDGYTITKIKSISGRDVYGSKIILMEDEHLVHNSKYISDEFDSEYIDIQIKMMIEAVNSNPYDAIGKAKELLESCCKTILNEEDKEVNKDWKVSKLMKETCKILELTPEDIEETKKASVTIKKVLGSLSAITQGISELRNSYGSGHGKLDQFKGLSPRHANLSVGASVLITRFLWDTYLERKKL